MIEVEFDGWLREYGPRGKETVEAESVEHLLDALEARHPRLRFKIRDETGRIRQYVRVFVDGHDVSTSGGPGASLVGAHSVTILHSIAGG